MRLVLLISLIILMIAPPVFGQKADPHVLFETSAGNFTVQLDPKAAPDTVENFLKYVRDGFYNQTIFHRVIKGFMIQGGGLTQDMQKKQTLKPVLNEADNGLKNSVGTIAMARTANPHSATAQFFINVANNDALNHRSKTNRGWGYCVFGRVTKGMEVVHKIEQVKTTIRSGRRDVPAEPVVIKKVSLVSSSDKP